MPDDTLHFAREVIDVEASAVAKMRDALDESFIRAVELIRSSTGSLVASGVGKAGHVARKLSATFASTGTPSHFLSPADAVHGDVGAVRSGDVVLLISSSGESDEIVKLLSILKKLGVPVIAMTSTRTNSLGRYADITLATGKIEEACPLGLAPSASTTAMMALGDALALSVMKSRNFTADDFALYHPAGQLGRKLMRVADAMSFKKGENLPLARDTLTVAQAFAEASKITRRPGAIILIDEVGKMSGLFTDGDLRRHIENNRPMTTPIAQVMTKNPRRIRYDELASEAMGLMRAHRFDEVPVVDEDDRPVGLIDVQDLVVLKMFDVS